MALSHALGVLSPVFSDAPREANLAEPLGVPEREWLLGRLESRGATSTHRGLLVAAVAEAAREEESALDHLLEVAHGPASWFDGLGLARSVLLGVFPDDERVVDLVCDELRSREYLSMALGLTADHLAELAAAYLPGTPHNGPVAAAIEERLGTFEQEKTSDRTLFRLSAIDQGPEMRRALLRELTESPWPHWAAEALAESFADDDEAQDAIRFVLMDEPVRASMIANVARRVLYPEEVVPRLLALLHELGGPSPVNSARYDFIASALVRACEEDHNTAGLDLNIVAEQSLALLPSNPGWLLRDSRYDVAARLYPSPASRAFLEERDGAVGRPLALYVRAYRNEPAQVQPLLTHAETALASLPAQLRGQLCQLLADRTVDPQVVLQLTQRWSDEVSDRNKSVASLAYHRALLRAREQGSANETQLREAQAHLREQASITGFDYEARRRAAWVGMCVYNDWSLFERRGRSSSGDTIAPISLADALHGPDTTLLQQLALHWDVLRSEFGASLLPHLSGTLGASHAEVWDSLALVAPQSATPSAGTRRCSR